MGVLNTAMAPTISSSNMVGCSQYLSSPERSAKHFVYASKDFMPSFYV